MDESVRNHLPEIPQVDHLEDPYQGVAKATQKGGSSRVLSDGPASIGEKRKAECMTNNGDAGSGHISVEELKDCIQVNEVTVEGRVKTGSKGKRIEKEAVKDKGRPKAVKDIGAKRRMLRSKQNGG